ncbi:MAG: hypothetical protein V1899_03260 [Planctomycetota bacterium]
MAKCAIGVSAVVLTTALTLVVSHGITGESNAENKSPINKDSITADKTVERNEKAKAKNNLLIKNNEHAADEKNPFKVAKVGDWIEYKMSNGPINGTLKKTVIKKTDIETTIEMVNNMGGQEMKQQAVIKFNEKYDPLNPDMLGSNVVIVDSGEENFAVADKTYSTKWAAIETPLVMDEKIMIKAKTWISTEVPLGGLVKSITEIDGSIVMLELIGFGNAK